jgi:hypothetical protein
MAGSDATFRFHADDRDLMVALMAAARRRARALGVRWQSSVSADGRGYCRMDGNSFRLDMLLERMRRDLPTIAEATPADRHAPAERRRLANGLIDVLCRSAGSYYDRYDEEGQPDYVPRLRRLRTSEVVPVRVLWPGDKHPDLYARLAITEEIMMSWALDEAAPEVVLEELHTAAELILMRLVEKRRAPAFAELVEAARADGHLEWPLGMHYADDAPEQIDDMADLLISLKDHRKRAKHQGSDEARAWLTVHFWPAGVVLERLCDRLQKA